MLNEKVSPAACCALNFVRISILCALGTEHTMADSEALTCAQVVDEAAVLGIVISDGRVIVILLRAG